MFHLRPALSFMNEIFMKESTKQANKGGQPNTETAFSAPFPFFFFLIFICFLPLSLPFPLLLLLLLHHPSCFSLLADSLFRCSFSFSHPFISSLSSFCSFRFPSCSFSFSPNNKMLLSVSADRTITFIPVQAGGSRNELMNE